MKILLDAGHGGIDPGCTYGSLNEKDLALEVTLRLYEELIYGHDVYLTRATDQATSFSTRIFLANKINPDLLVSIHFNADDNHQGFGHEILYHPSSKKGKKFADNLSDYFSQVMGLHNRGAKPRSNLSILSKIKMPAIIIECCFIHEEILQTKKTLYNMALVLGRGISIFKEVVCQ